MTASPFYKVSAVRKDGSANDTTFIGYAAESSACRFYRELEDSKCVAYVALIQRHTSGPDDKVSWEIMLQNMKLKDAAS